MCTVHPREDHVVVAALRAALADGDQVSLSG